MPRFPAPSPSVAAMQPSPYSRLAERAARSGRPVRPFHVGDTWLEPPSGAWMEDQRVAERPGLHRYGPVRGLPALLDAIVAKVAARTGERVATEQVLLTGGATAGLAAVVGAVVAPGDEVLILAPYWPLVSGTVQTYGARPVPVPVLHDGLPTPDALRAALAAAVTPRTVALYTNTPNNPTGRVFSAELLDVVAAFANDHGLWLIADEVYEDVRYRGAEHLPLRPLLPDRTFAVYSYSKAFGMAGNRVGYVIGPKAAMAEVGKVGIYTYYAAPTASQHAALVAMGPAGVAWQAAALASYSAVSEAAAARLGVEAPAGSTFLFVDVAAHLDDRGLDGFLGDCADDGVLVAPGTSFGPYPHHVRLCFTAVPPDDTLDGIDVFARRIGR